MIINKLLSQSEVNHPLTFSHDLTELVFQSLEKLEDEKMADEGRELRNEGRVEDGKPLKTTKPGTGHPEK